jgi:hypothetical protein
MIFANEVLGAEDRGALLGPAHEQHPPRSRRGRPGTRERRRLPFALGEVDQWHTLVAGEAVDAGDELAADRFQQRRRGKQMTAVAAEEVHDSNHELQLRDVHVEVHAVDDNPVGRAR